MQGAIIYHVCSRWDNGDLLSMYRQYGEEAYELYIKKWPDSNGLGEYHAHYIHCHYTLDEAKEYQAEYGGEILAINAEDLDVEVDGLEYPHPMVRDIIDASYIIGVVR